MASLAENSIQLACLANKYPEGGFLFFPAIKVLNILWVRHISPFNTVVIESSHLSPGYKSGQQSLY